MTAEYFETSVRSWTELLAAARELGNHELDGLMDSDTYVEKVEEDIDNRNCWFDELACLLRDLPTIDSDCAYSRESWLEYYAYDEETFWPYKANLLEWANNNNAWTVEYRDDSDESTEKDTHIDDGFSFELFSECLDYYANIK